MVGQGLGIDLSKIFVLLLHIVIPYKIRNLKSSSQLFMIFPSLFFFNKKDLERGKFIVNVENL